MIVELVLWHWQIPEYSLKELSKTFRDIMMKIWNASLTKVLYVYYQEKINPSQTVFVA